MFIEAAFSFLAHRKAPKRPEAQSLPSEKDLRRLNKIWDEEYLNARGRVIYTNSLLEQTHMNDVEQEAVAEFMAANVTVSRIAKDKTFKYPLLLINDVTNKTMERVLSILSNPPPPFNTKQEYIESAKEIADTINDQCLDKNGYYKLPVIKSQVRQLRIAIAAPLHRMHLAQTGE